MQQFPDENKTWICKSNDHSLSLKLESIAIPPLSADDVLVQNMAIGLNPVDWKVLGMKVGTVPGVDGAGIVVATGTNIPASCIGKRVAYHQDLHRAGSFAQYTAVKHSALLHIPETMNYVTAASIPCPALTAWQALDKIPTKVGRALLISGAGGSVGHYLTQLAVTRGFVVSTLAHSRHSDNLISLGAHHFFDKQQLAALLTQKHKFYAVIDAVSPENVFALAPLVQANGHLIAIQGRTEQWPTQPFSQAISLHEVALGALHQHGNDADWQELTEAGNALMQNIASGQLRPEPTHVADFTELEYQLDTLKNRNFTGKLIITTHSHSIWRS